MNRSELVRLLEANKIPVHQLQPPGQQGCVLVTPSLCGRVLALDLGPAHPLHTYLNPEQLVTGFKPHTGEGWNNFGGAERIWIGPEGGRFGLHFDDASQTMDRYRIPEASHCTKFMTQTADGQRVLMHAEAGFTNVQGSQFKLAIEREVRVIAECPLLRDVDPGPISGFETRSRIKNIGEQPWDWDSGLLSIWTLGQFLCRPGTVVLIPLRPGPEAELGPLVRTDYFEHLCPGGTMPDSAWQVSENLLLLNGAARVQTKIDVSARRAMGVLAALDLEEGWLTLVDFDMKPGQPYVAHSWLPFAGDLRDGPALSVFSLSGEMGEGGTAPFYELESYSPAMALRPGEAGEHRSRTWLSRLKVAAQSQFVENNFGIKREALIDFMAAAVR